jgi:hypothetical protein
MIGASWRLQHLLALVPVLGVTMNLPARADSIGIGAAERLLFESDHLANIPLPARLEYRYVRTGTDAGSDRIVIDIDRRRSVVADYLSGARHVNFPSIDAASGNPLLLYFLEDDLREMRRRTGGRPEYFRRLIRLAMARSDLKVEDTEVSFAGRSFPARCVTIEPFKADPHASARYPELVGKSYEFVLAEGVPGQVARLASRVPLPGGGAETVSIEWNGTGPVEPGP